MARKKPEIEEVTMELTPMIDVVFLLLIFFIVTMKFKVLEGKLETELPKDVGVNSGEVEDLLEKLEIKITANPTAENGMTIAINDLKMPNLQTFRSRIADFIRLDSEQKATLYPGPKVNYEQVVIVVDQCIMEDLVDITFAGVTWDA
ncbi:MAG: biopolymer transporter ExbD [Planctomycetota bacterium]|jgi:biopolymer transport protein ExbD|nr:biopolymer transporter ExbD [Planctomycetota bacterium]